MNHGRPLIEHLEALPDGFKQWDAKSYYEYLRTHISEIQKRYARGIMGIVDEEITQDIINELGSNIEALVLVDENDNPYQNNKGCWSSEFRQDYANYETLSESKERTIISRVSLFILEDNEGNILVSRRSAKKSHPNMLEIPGGHVTVGYDYLETCIKEIGEELGYTKVLVSEKDRLFKFRSSAPNPKPGTHGRGTIMATYRVRVPSKDGLTPDAEEIAELVTMTPEALLSAIQGGGKDHQFEVNHAYMYLEYLKMRLPQKVNEISAVQKKLDHRLSSMSKFSENETVSQE